MVLLTSPWPSSLPQMHPIQKNPFQNAPGLFIYALPNLAGTCPFSCSNTVLFCPSSDGAGNCNDAPDPNHPNHPNPHRHHRCCHSPPVPCHCRHHHGPPSESAKPLTAIPTKECAPPADTEPSPLPTRPRPQPSASLSPSEENHFGLGEISSSPPLTEVGPAQQEPQAGELASEGSTTPTPSTTAQSTPVKLSFHERPKEEGGEDEEEKNEEHTKRKRTRKRGKRRPQREYGGPLAPRFVGLFGMHYACQWAQYAYPPMVPPPPATMNHPYGWSFGGYPYYDGPAAGGFVLPPNSPVALPKARPLLEESIGVPLDKQYFC